ncbi:hypothetical protein C8R45DRAFT_1157494 [Mycena sanguinolenta]|nr:hypothetical protein C8R45DRAFT_1157494 [Mycena sanguinolenta]
MSAEKLRARIMELDSEIERQKSLLEQLENDRILALPQLNAALDPVAHLPLEISSEIFLQSLAPSPSGNQDVPTALLCICSAWTDIALATPALWATVRIHFPCGENFANVLWIWFNRARNLPLSVSISLQGPSINWNHRVSGVLWEHGGQLQHLEILDNDDLGTKYLWGFDDQPTINLFGDTPLTRNVPGPEDLFIIPTLRRVIFGGNYYSGDDRLLLWLALPALETLSLPMRRISGEHVVAFIQRSAAPLQDLTLACGSVTSVQLHNLLPLIPTLTRFTIHGPDSDVVTELFVALAHTPSLLSNLRNLIIDLLFRDISDSSWRNLVLSPPVDVLASLRELAGQGVKMYVGTEELNYVAA